MAIRTREMIGFFSGVAVLSEKGGSITPYLVILLSINFLMSPFEDRKTSRSCEVSSKYLLDLGLKASPISPTHPVYLFLIT